MQPTEKSTVQRQLAPPKPIAIRARISVQIGNKVAVSHSGSTVTVVVVSVLSFVLVLVSMIYVVSVVSVLETVLVVSSVVIGLGVGVSVTIEGKVVVDISSPVLGTTDVY